MAYARFVIVGVAIVVHTAPLPLGAQEDFRSVDPSRPIRLEDAYPVKYLEWEWEVGTETLVAEGAQRGVTGLIELKLGIAPNWQAGIEVRPSWEDVAGVSAGGVEEFGLHLLFNVNQEGRAAPAFAFRGDLFTPGVGDVGRETFGGRVLGLSTKSFGRARLHANGGYAVASDADAGAFGVAALGFDAPLGFFSQSILGDLYWEIPIDGSAARVWAEVGTRLQITNTSVIDAGISSRLDVWADGIANIAVVIGLSRVFGIPGLVKVPAYPRPRIN